jgi:AcrR family transcriptional regulator
MDPDKKDRLINAAMKEFGANRFEKASTNTIVKEAGISKGLLYHYFDSKDALYSYLFEYAMTSVAVPIAEQVGLEETDILKRIEQISHLKIKIFHQMPALVSFSKTMYAGMDFEEIKKMIQKYNPIPMDMYYHHNIDTSLFKDEIDINMAIQNIQYTLERISEAYITQLNMGIDIDIDKIMTEFEGFLTHFRQIYYK